MLSEGIKIYGGKQFVLLGVSVVECKGIENELQRTDSIDNSILPLGINRYIGFNESADKFHISFKPHNLWAIQDLFDEALSRNTEHVIVEYWNKGECAEG